MDDRAGKGRRDGEETVSDSLVIGITGTRGSGKDTLFNLLSRLDVRCVRFAFADPLRVELNPFLLSHFGVDIWDCTPVEKEMVRPLLIGHGMARRNQDPLYWVRKTVDAMHADMVAVEKLGAILIPVITDVRFENEATFLREAFPGFRLVDVVRDGAPPPTEEEEKHFRKVAVMADIRLEWGNDDDEAQLARARGILKRLLT